MLVEDEWWLALNRLFSIVHSPAKTSAGVARQPALFNTFSHILVIKLILGAMLLYIDTTARVAPSVLIEELVPNLMWFAVFLIPAIVVEACMVAIIPWGAARLEGHQIRWSWLMVVGMLSQVPRIVELVVRLFFMLVVENPASVPNQISFGPLVGVPIGLGAALLNPFMYWQVLIILCAVRDLHAKRWNMTVVGTLTVLLQSVFSA